MADEPCDMCDVYHQLGWDECPACCLSRSPTVPSDPWTLLTDVVASMHEALYAGGLGVATGQVVQGWITKLNAARLLLRPRQRKEDAEDENED